MGKTGIYTCGPGTEDKANFLVLGNNLAKVVKIRNFCSAWEVYQLDFLVIQSGKSNLCKPTHLSGNQETKCLKRDWCFGVRETMQKNTVYPDWFSGGMVWTWRVFHDSTNCEIKTLRTTLDFSPTIQRKRDFHFSGIKQQKTMSEIWSENRVQHASGTLRIKKKLKKTGTAKIHKLKIEMIVS